MKAIAYYKSLPIEDPASLEDVELSDAVAGPRDLLVRVSAISVNPVDTKMRRNSAPATGQANVLGWDAVGIVEAVGRDVTLFKVGERVFYAGSIKRPGANSELHAVDERIVARAPRSLNDADAAALPLTSLTAYELLFERMRIAKTGGADKKILIVGGAGGVGSIAIQIARQLTNLQVIATASRPETRKWCLDLGAHFVIDHSKPLTGELAAAGLGSVDYVISLTQMKQHYAEIVESLKPQGRIGAIDDMTGLDPMLLKGKSLSLYWELMFTRSSYQTADMAAQGRLLAEIADLVDAGRIRSTATVHLGSINAANLKKAHALVESGKALGKVVLSTFE